MTAGTETRPAFNPFFALFVLALSIALGIGIIVVGKLAIYAIFAIMLFFLFTHYPVLGFYATTVLLLLSGSAGVIGWVSPDTTLAVTLAKLCGLAALAAWLVNLLTRKLRIELNWPTMLLSLFVMWALVGSVLSTDVSQTWPEWVRLFTLLGFFWLGVNTLGTARNLHTFVVVISLCGLAMSFVAVAQYFLPQYQFAGAEAWGTLGATDGAYIDQESLSGEAAIRVSGRAGHSNWLAMIILLILPLNIYWYSTAISRRLKLFIFSIVSIEVIALVLTFTRTGLVIGVVLAALLLAKRFVRISPVRVFMVLFALVIAWVLLPAAYKERVLSPKQYTTSKSVQSRMVLQTAAAEYFAENPAFGLGLGGFGLEFMHENNETARLMQFMVQRQGWLPVFIGTHNMYLQLGCDTGVLGLFLFLAFVLTMAKALSREEQRYRENGDEQGAALAASLLVSLLGFMLCAVFLHALTQKIWWMVAAAAVALPLYHVDFREGLAPILPWTTKTHTK